MGWAPHSTVTVGMEHKDAMDTDHKDAAGMDHKDAPGMEHKDAVGMNHKDATGTDHKDAAGMDHKNAVGMDHKDAPGMEHKDAVGTDHKDAVAFLVHSPPGREAGKQSSQSIYYLKTNFSKEERKDDKQVPLSRVACNYQEKIVAYQHQEPGLSRKHCSREALGTFVK